MAVSLYMGWLNPAVGDNPEWWHREEVKIFRPATLEARQTPGEYPIATQTQYTFQEQDEPTNIMDMFSRLQSSAAPHDKLYFFSSDEDGAILPFVLKNTGTFNEDFGHFEIVNEENGAKICFDGRYKNIDSVDLNYDRILGHICLVGNLNYEYNGDIFSLIRSAESYENARLDAGAHTFYNYPVNMLFMPAYQKSHIYTHEPINWWYSAPTGEWMGGVNNDIRNLASTWQWRQFITGDRHIDNPPKLLLAGSDKGVEIGLPFTKVGEYYLYDSTYETENATPTGTTIKTNSLRYYSLGTEIKSLFNEEPSNVEEVIYLENGWISRQMVAGNLYYRFGYGENFLEWKMLPDSHYASGTKYELYLIANEAFAKIDADKWIDHVPDDYTPGDFETSPFLLYRYGGSIPPQYAKVNFFDYDTYPGAVWPVMATNLVSGAWGDFFELCTLTNYSNATKDTWKGLLVGFEGKGTNWGETTAGGGFSHTAGGKGGFNDSGDAIPESSLPSTGDTSKLIGAYAVGSTVLGAVSDYLNSGDIFATSGKKQAIIDAICSLKVCYLPNTLDTAGSRSIKIGNALEAKTLRYYNCSDLGKITFKIEPYFDNFADLQSSVQLYLPYVGMEELPISAILGKDCEISMRFDPFSASILYTLSITDLGRKFVIKTFTGAVGMEIPLTSTDYSGKISSTLNTILGVGETIVGGATGNAVLAGAGVATTVGGIKGLATSATPVGGGSVPGFIGNMAPRQIYLLITRKPWNVPENYAHQYGLPSNITAKMANLKGFTKIASIHLDGFPGTKEEKERLMSKLQKGVVIR